MTCAPGYSSPTLTKKLRHIEAGMRRGDIIVAIDQEPVTNSGELARYLFRHGPGSQAQFTYYRGVERHTVELTLGE